MTASRRVGRRRSLLRSSLTMVAIERASKLPEDRRKLFMKYYIYGKIYNANDAKIDIWIAQHYLRT